MENIYLVPVVSIAYIMAINRYLQFEMSNPNSYLGLLTLSPDEPDEAQPFNSAVEFYIDWLCQKSVTTSTGVR